MREHRPMFYMVLAFFGSLALVWLYICWLVFTIFRLGVDYGPSTLDVKPYSVTVTEDFVVQDGGHIDLLQPAGRNQ